MNISILGSTGSIGTQTLDVVDTVESINVVGLTTNSNIDLLEKQIDKYNPEVVCVVDKVKAKELQERLKNKQKKVEVVAGVNGLVDISTHSKTNTVVNSVVGSVGLIPTMEAIKKGKNIALANKETLVTGGKLITSLVKKHGVTMLPVDSEHSAIFQCLQGNEHNEIQNIYLTASGGSFRDKTKEELENVTLEDALKHPNWSMGQKITIDSATLMNKGLEVIEAKWLFDIDADNIKVLVHRQSIVHSMVEFVDNSVIAQLGEPDMRVPIQYALTYPNRVANNFGKMNLVGNNLTFEEPKYDLFPCLTYAYDAIKIGGNMATIYNSANEMAVQLFLDGKIKYLDIQKLVHDAMDSYLPKVVINYTVDDIIIADEYARKFVRDSVI